jgi:Domain of unknown function (DUF5925)/ATPase family associated with various cellular activities (AAA)
MSEPPRTDIRLGHDLQETEGLPGALLMRRAAAEGLQEIHTANWPTSVKSIEAVGTPLARSISHGGESALYEESGVLFEVHLWGSSVTVTAAGRKREDVTRVVERLEKLFPPPDPSSSHEVPVTFWMYTPQGPRPSWRPIAVPAWEEIEANYATRTRDELAALMSDFQPARGGQLILWHGDAGTGKTFALRALAWEWREWCQIHYIVDPDSFFGEHADYLMSVLLEPPFPMMIGGERFGPSVGITAYQEVLEDFEGDGEDDDRLWRLLVMEDTGELLSADARERTGQGLSRFLNVVDGLIGQGLRVIVLVTTNEEIKKLHPAVARPGRCAANVMFDALSRDEASEWLSAHGVDEESRGARTLASLYAQAEGRDPTETVLVGFGG